MTTNYDCVKNFLSKLFELQRHKNLYHHPLFFYFILLLIYFCASSSRVDPQQSGINYDSDFFMVLILDGSSLSDVHVWSENSHSTRSRHLLKSTPSSLILFQYLIPFTRASFNALPSNKSTMDS